ncbi:ABC transporter permease [Martelella alba]|uniref:ABC transporter permease n=1 Tax=Martelella alba TaxID=2590451 RepID=A0A506U5X8_9HYPH|nr:ABC transporter permease [Martelella alba]TPW27337.1 ABC transporter permease [Martelella alba]
MLGFIGKRLLATVLTLLAISVLIFIAGSVLPGDAAQMQLNVFANDTNLAALREQMGLNQPIWHRYLSWLFAAVRGDLGTSMSFQTPIAPLVIDRFEQSAILTVAAMAVSVPLALILGLLSGLYRNRLPDYLMTGVGLLGISVPEFVWGVLLIVIFSDRLGLLPPTSITDGSALQDPQVLVLPVLTLTLLTLAQVGRLMRSGVVSTLKEDFIRTARLKGATPGRTVFRHIFPNSVSPAISAIGLNFGWMFGSLAVIETLFSYPGLGNLIVFSVQNRDIPLLQAAVLFVSLVVCLGNLAADLVILALDPRLRSRAGS